MFIRGNGAKGLGKGKECVIIVKVRKCTKESGGLESEKDGVVFMLIKELLKASGKMVNYGK
jgi:hypothetical protein